MTGDLWTHAQRKGSGAVRPSYIWRLKYSLSAMLYVIGSLHGITIQKSICVACNPRVQMMAGTPCNNSKVSLLFVVSYVQCSTRYTAVWINNCSNSTSVIKVGSITNTNDFHRKKPWISHATTKLTHLAVSKDEWNTKEDTGKSMKNALYTLWCAKRHKAHLGTKQRRTVKK